MSVPRDVPDDVVRARLRTIDPPKRIALDIVKIAVVVAMLVVGVVMRFEPMPARVVGGGMIGVGVLLLAVWGKAASRRGRDREARLVAALGSRAFSINGYPMWLVADIPMVDVKLAAPGKLDQVLDTEAKVEQLDDRTIRIKLPPRRVGSIRGGDPDRLRKLLDRWPAELPIEALELGGALDDTSVN